MESNTVRNSEFNIMIYEEIQDLLEQKIGLDSNSIGSATIKRSIDKCFELSGCKDIAEYRDQLKVSHELMSELIESVVVPETWFFRNKRPFELLEDYIRKDWYLNNIYKTMNILSIPCSTGEEPYSIAMVMKELMLPIAKIKIDAVDISEEALKRAKKGIYRNNSFRGEKQELCEKYFTELGGSYELSKDIRSMVTFSQGNLLENKLLPPDGGYDFIFCRNLLIYFDRETQEKAVAILRRLLSDDGILFIGHAEGSYIFENGFELLNARGAFAYKKSSKQQHKNIDQQDLKLPDKVQDIGIKKKHKRHKTQKPQVNNNLDDESKSVGTSDGGEETLSRGVVAGENNKFMMAKSLADNGELSESIRLCEEYLLEHGGDVDANYLLAVLYEATGEDKKSLGLFRKIIYLDPDHYEALTYLALQSERDGEKDSAIAFRRRAQRAEKRRNK